MTTTTTLDPAATTTAVLEHLERCWNEADGSGFGQPFAADCDFVDIRGGHHRGRAAVGAGHQALFDSIYRGSTVRYRLDSVRELVPGCLVAIASATLDAPTGPAQGVGHSRITLVLTERDGVWPVAAFHNTLVQERG
jgi:uncharacterized protein (TIGR02246 family)